MDLDAVLLEARNILKGGGIECYESESRTILCSVMNLGPHRLLRSSLDVDSESADKIFRICRTRAAGYPLQYLLEKVWFGKADLKIVPGVKIPVYTTEDVCEIAIKEIGARRLTVVDDGCGSGAISIAIAMECPGARFVCTDISDAALRLTCENATGSAVVERMSFVKSDFTSCLKEASVDVLVTNPPYVFLRERVEFTVLFEPPLSIFLPEASLERQLTYAYHCVKPGGVLIMECGLENSGPVLEFLSSKGWSADLVKDNEGIPRIIFARKKP